VKILEARAFALACLLAFGAASAAEETDGQPTYSGSVAFMFFLSCVQYAGDAAGLRTRLETQGANKAPDSEAARYLRGQPGRVYGTRNPQGMQLFISHDDGGCELLAQNVNEKEFRPEFDTLVKALTVIKSHEHEEPAEGLKHLEYELRDAKKTRGWKVELAFPLPGVAVQFSLMSAYPVPVKAPTKKK